MTRKELLDDLLDSIREAIDRHTRTCVNCQYFTVATEVCQYAQLRPPARVIACGCECWVEK